MFYTKRDDGHFCKGNPCDDDGVYQNLFIVNAL